MYEANFNKVRQGNRLLKCLNQLIFPCTVSSNSNLNIFNNKIITSTDL